MHPIHPMPHIHWFATIDGAVLGPLTPVQLQVLVELGWVQAETPIRHELMTRTVPAAAVHGLPRFHRPASPPPGSSGACPSRLSIGLRGLAWFLAGVVCALLAQVVILA
jgi:hypothetical protein